MPEPKPARPPGGAIRVALSGTYGVSKWVNRFWLHAVYGSTPSAAQLLTLSNAVAASFRTRFGPHLSSDWHSATQRTVLYVDADTEIAVDGVDTGSGTISTTEQAAALAYLINWSIAGTYRGGHPRSYLAGVTTDGLADVKTVATARRTALTADAQGFLADVNALTPSGFTSVALGTYRFFRNHSAVSPPVFEPYLSGACATIFGNQRRRLRS